MGYKDFPETLMLKVAETGEEVECGGFHVGYHQELKYLLAAVYIQGAASGSEEFRANIYADSAYSKQLYQSDWSALSDISNLGANWIGRLRFTFDRKHLNKNLIYYVAVESQNYTRNLDTFYVGLVLDWPLPVNTHNTSGIYAPEISFFGFR